MSSRSRSAIRKFRFALFSFACTNCDCAVCVVRSISKPWCPSALRGSSIRNARAFTSVDRGSGPTGARLAGVCSDPHTSRPLCLPRPTRQRGASLSHQQTRARQLPPPTQRARPSQARGNNSQIINRSDCCYLYCQLCHPCSSREEHTQIRNENSRKTRN